MSEEDRDKDLNEGTNGPAARRRPKSVRRPDAQIDLREALEAPVRVKRDGALGPMHPYEATLRQHVRRSLVDKRVDSMEVALSEAEKHKLIKEPPSRATGGVFIVPKELPEETQRKIFDDPGYAAGKQTSMSSIWWFVLLFVSFERFVECFNGRKKSK
jgi:hypothetical protein